MSEASKLTDFSKLAVHTQTNKPWSLAECLEHYASAGIPGISVWRQVIEPIGIDEAAKLVKASGMAVPALVRGGFFTAFDAADRAKAVDINKVCIDEAAAIGADQVVLVVGATPGQTLEESRKQVTEGIAACVDHAKASNVKLAIEPLHPMYAADKSSVNRMKEAREICQAIGSEMVGIAADVYHIWWDPDVEEEIKLAGELGLIFGFHICDWRVNTRDLLTDRGLMGDGCIDIAHLRGLVEATGFNGYNEVEVFSNDYWAMDQHEYLNKIKETYLSKS